MTTPKNMPAQCLRIALLHLAPIPGDLVYNRQLVEAGVTAAARLGAQWAITPELCICGYTFADRLGTDWIVPAPDLWMRAFCELVAKLRLTVFLSHPERDPETARLHNSVFVIDAQGSVLGRHRKINTLKVGSESWSSAGEDIAPIAVHPVGRVGVLICADAYSPGIANSLKAQNAELLVSSAAWAPGLHGPNGEWEKVTADTGLPLLVCNRTGPDRVLDFREAQSVVVKDAGRLASFCAERSTVFIIDWDVERRVLLSSRAHALPDLT